MIGQVHNIERFSKLKEGGRIPQFIIVSGPEHSGKGTLIKEFCNIIGPQATVNRMTASVEAMRDMINNKVSSTTIYIIEEFETLSPAGQNSVLKVFEEPPENCFYVISTKDESLLLNTIVSRGQVFNMEPYTEQELNTFLESFHVKDDIKKDLLKLCESPAEILYWKDRNVQDFKDLVTSFYMVLLKRDVAFSIQNLSKISYDPNEEKPYYLFFLRNLAAKLSLEFDWKSFAQFKDFLKYTDEAKRFTKNDGVKKPELMDSYIMTLWYILHDPSYK